MKSERLNLLKQFTPGDKVRIKKVRFDNHASYEGREGKVKKTIKSQGLVAITLEDGTSWHAYPENVMKVKT